MIQMDKGKKVLKFMAILLLIILLITALIKVKQTFIDTSWRKVETSNGEQFIISDSLAPIWYSPSTTHKISIYHNSRIVMWEYVDFKPYEISLWYDGLINECKFYRIDVYGSETGRKNEIRVMAKYFLKDNGDEIKGRPMYLSLSDDTERDYVYNEIIKGDHDWIFYHGDDLYQYGYTDIMSVVENIVSNESYSGDYFFSQLHDDRDAFYKVAGEFLKKWNK